MFDVANLRQADQPGWYSMPRGEFPFGAGSERARWVRTVDEYFPAALRSFVTIDHASESVVGAETMRHLVVTVDAAGIAAAAAATTTDLHRSPGCSSATGAWRVRPPREHHNTPETIEPMTIEMWVDTNGLIRKLVEPPSMGGETITVTSLSPDAFTPAFPAPEVVRAGQR